MTSLVAALFSRSRHPAPLVAGLSPRAASCRDRPGRRAAAQADDDVVSERYLAWSLAAVGLLIGIVVIRVVDNSLARFVAKVEYERTLEILCQRSIKLFLWLILNHPD